MSRWTIPIEWAASKGSATSMAILKQLLKFQKAEVKEKHVPVGWKIFLLRSPID